MIKQSIKQRCTVGIGVEILFSIDDKYFNEILWMQDMTSFVFYIFYLLLFRYMNVQGFLLQLLLPV
jgi:hypothetical protein